MGRYDNSSRSKVEDVKTIGIPFLRKNNYFCGYNSGNITWTTSGAWGERKSSVSIAVTVNDTVNQLKITYTQTDRDTQEKKDFDYKIPLVSTQCGYGGVRWWFICPWYKNGVYCGKRVGKLYKDGDYFACRHCYNLTYEARNENRKWKWLPLFGVFDILKEIEELELKIKRRSYRGKPTRLQRKLLNLYRQADASTLSEEQVKAMLRDK